MTVPATDPGRSRHAQYPGRKETAGLDKIRAFVDTEIAPFADAWDQAEQLPSELLTRIGELGLWAPFLPPDDGGSGMDWTGIGQVHEEIGRGCSSVRSFLTVHTMVTWTVQRWGSAEQQARWLPRLATGELIGAFCLTEPDSGSDAAAMGTVAQPADSGWILNGHKKWMTAGQVAGLLLVFARTEAGMSAFLVPADTPGVRISPLNAVMGTRASMLAEIVLREVHVGPDALIGPPGWAAGTVMTGALDLGRYSVACGCVGVVQACLDACVAYTSKRRVRDGRLSELQLIRRKISDMVVSSRAARLLCAEAGRLKDTDDPATIMATWVAKYHASTAATAAASDAVQIHGANGFVSDYPVARLYRDAKVAEIIEGSTELQQITIADEAYREVAR
ncbi:acyl-CoA dehydrogenase family protein [Streptomyces zagrosensis]|uniref:Alkylation response protein AidB-like acyl-CoA dehydrogenase n=1 Tax=Streptomyces zagrosensis TaxID=1042984 RepID=A0A7W9QCW2_9ACTN|nr:acyl-CoA dehydrogenase family protein [Streptomyces zagrosensis]MBB5936682.1 alkylation response protein AidB-like acyl-CoA dehydrogenase [Streptomyces zagrosensis]